jgi:maltooligosyltrehalose trehalohydrolase
VDHGEPDLIEAVRRGRREEFASFGWAGEVPDPGAPATFERSRIDPAKAGDGRHAGVLALHTELLSLRRSLAALRPGAASVSTACDEERRWVAALYRAPECTVLVGFNFATDACSLSSASLSGVPRLVLSTDEARFGGEERPAGAEDGGLRLPPETARLWTVEAAA